MIREATRMVRPVEGGPRSDAGTGGGGDLGAIRRELAELKADIARRDESLRDFLALLVGASETVTTSSQRLLRKL